MRAVPPDVVLRLVEDPGFGYEDFAPRGEQSPPTMRAQVWRTCVPDYAHACNYRCLRPRLEGLRLSQVWLLRLLMRLPDACRTTPGRTTASLWSTDYCQIWASSWMRSSRYTLSLANSNLTEILGKAVLNWFWVVMVGVFDLFMKQKQGQQHFIDSYI